MPVTLGVVANIYNEANALPGWLEVHSAFADHISIYHAGPGGVWSDDGTMEILEKWKIPVHRGSIDEGFGVCRTAAVRSSPCDWVILLDADERFWQYAPKMTCTGESTPQPVVDAILTEYTSFGRVPAKPVLQKYDLPDTHQAMPCNIENVGLLGAKLKVNFDGNYDQGAWLRSTIEHGSLDAVKTIRRHWHDFSWKRPTQNWHTHEDFQIRILRNKDSIHFAPGVRMHEQLVGASNVYMPNHQHGPFFDHYHLFFKKMEMLQRQYDVAIYDAINEGRKPPTLEEFKGGQS